MKSLVAVAALGLMIVSSGAQAQFTLPNWSPPPQPTFNPPPNSFGTPQFIPMPQYQPMPMPQPVPLKWTPNLGPPAKL
jgi:hypothetical protein